MLHRTDKGLTLIELLVTIALVAVVASIAVPVLLNTVSKAQTTADTQSSNNVTAFTAQYTSAGYVVAEGTGSYAGYKVAFDDANGNGTLDAGETVIAKIVLAGNVTPGGGNDGNNGGNGGGGQNTCGTDLGSSDAVIAGINAYLQANACRTWINYFANNTYMPTELILIAGDMQMSTWETNGYRTHQTGAAWSMNPNDAVFVMGNINFQTQMVSVTAGQPLHYWYRAPGSQTWVDFGEYPNTENYDYSYSLLYETGEFF